MLDLIAGLNSIAFCEEKTQSFMPSSTGIDCSELDLHLITSSVLIDFVYFCVHGSLEIYFTFTLAENFMVQEDTLT